MPIFSGVPSSCTGSVFGVFSGSIATGLTASYSNYTGGPPACTGSTLIQSYTLSTGSQTGLGGGNGQNRGDRFYIRLSGSHRGGDYTAEGADKWVLIRGATEAWEEANSVDGTVLTVMDEVTYIPGATIFLSASTAAQDLKYTFPTPRMGLEYTFISNCSASTGAAVWFSAPTANTLAVQLQCKDGRKSDTNKTNLKFLAAHASLKLGDRFTCTSDGTGWFVSGITDSNQDFVTID